MWCLGCVGDVHKIPSTGRWEGYDQHMYHTRALTPADLGAAIRDARREKGWQQTELAAVLGVSRMTVSRLERGGSVSMDTAMHALAELGREAVIVPKFARVRITDG